MPRLSFAEVRGLLAPGRRRELDALAGRAPRRAKALKAEPVQVVPSERIEGLWSTWTWKTCERCWVEWLGPDGIRCPIECWDWVEQAGCSKARSRGSSSERSG